MPHHPRINSDQFAQGLFRPHGRAELWAEGKVIYLQAVGPFNMEAVAAIGGAWRQLFAEGPAAEAFADIVLVSNSMLAGPEVMAAFGQFLLANSAAGIAPMAVAWVVPPEVEGATIMIPQFRRTYAMAGRNIAFFEREAEAEAWVRQQLQQPAG